MSFRWARVAVAALFLAFAVEAALFALLGRTNIDEGMFLGAARLVYQGELLYRDFPFSQGPTLPYVYGFLTQLFGSSIAVGRAVSWIGCLVSAGSVLWIATRFGGRLAAGLAMVLAMGNLPALWVSATVRTQALATPLVLLAVVALATPARTALGWAAAPSLLLWSSGARITNGLAFVVALVWVARALRRAPGLRFKVAAIVSGQAALVFAPMWLAPGSSLFHVFGAQLTRGVRTGVRDLPVLEALGQSLGFPLEPVNGFLPIVGLGLLAVLALMPQLRRATLSLPISDPVSARLVLLALAALVYAPHLFLNRPYLTYFVTSSWLLVPVVAIALASWGSAPARLAWAGRALVGIALAALAGNAAVRWHGFVGSGKGSFSHFRSVGAELGALAGPDCTMVTFQTQLAVEAGCRPLPGLEYSLFSWYPGMQDGEAAARGVLNPALLDRSVAELRPELVAVSRADARRFAGSRAATRTDLGFLPSARKDYVRHSVVEMASGMRLPGGAQALRVEVYARRDLLAPSESAAKNVVWVLADTLRADHLGVYGYERATSPVIDAFAQEAVLFENTRSQAPCTVPSVNSLLTARHPLRFQGARKKSLTMPLGIPAAFPSAAELFARRGYATAAVSASPVVRQTPTRHNRQGGFDRGFDIFHEDCLWKDGNCVNRAAFALLDRLEEPFFLYLHYMDPHSPYQPPASHGRRFARGEPEAEFVAKGDPKPVGRMLYAGGPEVSLSESDRQHLIDLYDDEILYFDGRFGALLAELEHRGLAERSVVVLSADHGEDFLDHGDIEHCRNLYDTEIRTPLVLRVPGAPARRVAATVQNVDILPTLVDLLGLEAPVEGFDGRSLRPLIEGGAAPPRPALAAWNTWLSVVDGGRKLLIDTESGRSELYDLAADPGEADDLSAARPGEAARLRALLDAELRERGIDRAAGLATSREIQEQLRALGYLE